MDRGLWSGVLRGRPCLEGNVSAPGASGNVCTVAVPPPTVLGACVCMGCSALAQHNGVWALNLVPKGAGNDSKRG